MWKVWPYTFHEYDDVTLSYERIPITGELNFDLSEFTIDPTLKRTSSGSAAPAGKKTFAGKAKKAAAPARETSRGINLPNFLKPYDSGKETYSEVLNRKSK